MQAGLMKDLWKMWTIDKPAAVGDWLWDVFVVQLAALLDKLTLRQVIAFIPVVILVLAYSHSIPLPPELVLLGDLLAYIDIFSLLFLLALLSRVATVVFIVKQATALAASLMSRLLDGVQRLDCRHRREGAARNQKRKTNRAKDNDDEHVIIHGVAWA
jgi:hypothetical protein